jgi:hypothetical protein
MKHSDAEIISAIEASGMPWQEHFALDSGLVAFEDASGRLFFHVIENDELNAAALAFLRRQGKCCASSGRHAAKPDTHRTLKNA